MAKRKETITRSELSRLLSEKQNITIKEADENIKHLVDIIINQVKSGKRIEIREFGIFEGIERKARSGRNISTGEQVDIPAYTKFVFKPSKRIAKI